jgi:Carboxypeptidase regulatory-like domain
VFHGAPLIAQTSTGTIVGAVTDPSGSAVANCRVTIRHLAASEVREVVANERGKFSVPFLRIGDYSVAAAAPEFKIKVVTPITVRVDQTVDIRSNWRSERSPNRCKSPPRRPFSTRPPPHWVR